MRRLYRDLATIRSARFCALALSYGAAMTGTLWLAYLLRFDFQVPAWRCANDRLDRRLEDRSTPRLRAVQGLADVL